MNSRVASFLPALMICIILTIALLALIIFINVFYDADSNMWHGRHRKRERLRSKENISFNENTVVDESIEIDEYEKFQRLRKYVTSSSKQLRMLDDINAKYERAFLPVDSRIRLPIYQASSLAKYKSLSFEMALKNILRDGDKAEAMTEEYEKAARNARNYARYKRDLAGLRNVMSFPSEFTLDNIGVSLEAYRNCETQCFNGMLLHPVTSIVFTVAITYKSPGGRTDECKRYDFGYDEFRKIVAEIEKEEEEKKSEAYRRKRARSAVTAKLRYKILKRDGYRCCICGRGKDDGVKLCVDHIRPVSKGGETVESNLQTLCEECNLGKSNQWDG